MEGWVEGDGGVGGEVMEGWVRGDGGVGEG